MNKRIALLTVILLLVFVASALSTGLIASAEPATGTFLSGTLRSILLDVSSTTHRTVGTEEELQFAECLVSRLGALGYTSLDGTPLKVQPFAFTSNSYDEDFSSPTYGEYFSHQQTSQNVVAFRSCGQENAPLIIFGTGYSNGYSLAVPGSPELANEQCVGENAGSIAVLLKLAESMRTRTLDYDVAFAFWGGSYHGYAGADEFLKKVNRPITGYVDIGPILVGDHLYLYADEKASDQESFMLSLLHRGAFGSIELLSKPFDPGYTLVGDGGFPYTHPGLDGYNRVFMSRGIASLRLFGYNWAGGLNNAESATKEGLLYTKYDTLPDIQRVYGDEHIDARMEAVSKILTTSAFSQGFAQSFAKGPDYLGAISATTELVLPICAALLFVVGLVIINVLAKRRAKTAGTPDFAVGSEFLNGKTEQSTDIFGDSASIDPFEGTRPIPGDSNAVEKPSEEGQSTDIDPFDEM